VRKLDNRKVYAMKVMRKERILARDHGGYVRAERDVLTAVFHPYIVTLRFSFQTSSKLYLVLDFINGGHLFFALYRAGIFDEEARAAARPPPRRALSMTGVRAGVPLKAQEGGQSAEAALTAARAPAGQRQRQLSCQSTPVCQYHHGCLQHATGQRLPRRSRAPAWPRPR